MIAGIRELKHEGFTTRHALGLMLTIGKMRILPHRTSTVDPEALDRGELAFKATTWWFRGRKVFERRHNPPRRVFSP